MMPEPFRACGGRTWHAAPVLRVMPFRQVMQCSTISTSRAAPAWAAAFTPPRFVSHATMPTAARTAAARRDVSGPIGGDARQCVQLAARKRFH
ncbi:hypothetical protein BGC_22280 [Burkholderia sp. 3C]